MAMSRRTNLCSSRQTQSFMWLGKPRGIAIDMCLRHTCVLPSTHKIYFFERTDSLWFSSKVFLKEVLLFQMCKVT